MPELDFQPEMVGRDEDLKELQDCLDRAAEGRGRTLFISGEAGIGKTRLVDELKLVARSRGFQILSGNCLHESLTPYMPFMEALRSGDLGHLFAEETPKVEWVYLVTDTGLLIKEVLRGETQLDSDTFASMLKTVSDFVRDSLSMLSGDEKEGALSSLGYEDYRILIERGVNVNLAVVLTGRENEFLVNDMREILLETDRKYGDVLKAWDGEEGKVRGIEKLLKPLITSGKYDGIYYGRENPKARRNLLLENVSLGLMRQAQTRPTLLCIEDLQWADPSTLAMMHYVARNVRKCGLLILGTYRPEDVAVEDGLGHPLSERMQLMSREELHEKMDLQRLPKESMVGVLSSMLGEIDFSDDFGNRFYKETEGNPLFVIELVKLMVDEEIIKTDNRTWKLVKNLEEASIPSKIYDVIVRRLNRVEREERRVLDYASVVGEAFTSTILASALNEKRMQLLERLRGLEQTHRLIHSHDGGYRFDHAKIKEVLYNEIPEELRTEYHSIIADSIEELHKDDLDEVMEDLAFHYYRCENREKALLYLSKAAEKAKKEYSNEEAIRFYTEALELEDDAQKRMEIFECLGGVYFLIGDYKKSIESRESALELTKERRKRAEIKVWIGDAYDSKGESDESMKLCTEALELVKGEECKEEALAFGLIGSIHNQRGEYDRALEHHEKSLEIREKIEDQNGIAKSHSNMGNVHRNRGEYDRALEHYQRCLEIKKNIEDQWAVATCLGNMSNVYFDRGEYDRALEHDARSLEIREKIGDQPGTAQSLNNIGTGHLERGEYDRAMEHFEKSLEIGKRIGDQGGIAGSLLNIGILCTNRGEYDRAMEHFEKSLGIFEKLGSHKGIAHVLNNIGSVYLHSGECERALEYYERSLEIKEKIGDPWGLAETCCCIAEVHCEKSELRRAVDFCNRASDLSEECGLKEYLGRSRRIFGTIFRERKEWKESIESFEESIEIFREMGMKKELGESNYEFGLMWKAKGDFANAKERFDRASEIFGKLSLEKNLKEVREASSDLTGYEMVGI